MRGKTSGIDAELEYRTVVTFRDGKQIRSEWFVDRGDALDVLGSGRGG